MRMLLVTFIDNFRPLQGQSATGEPSPLRALLFFQSCFDQISTPYSRLQIHNIYMFVRHEESSAVETAGEFNTKEEANTNYTKKVY